MKPGLALVACAVALLAVAPAAGAGTGIRGRVVASPTCPVERDPPDPQCAPRALAAVVRIYRLSDHHTVARLHTGDDGRFRLRLRRGRYGVNARPAAGGLLPSCPKGVRATVRRGHFTRVTIDCDTGIR